MEHKHTIDPDSNSRHPNCICGEVFWTGTRWTAVPDESLYR